MNHSMIRWSILVSKSSLIFISVLNEKWMKKTPVQGRENSTRSHSHSCAAGIIFMAGLATRIFREKKKVFCKTRLMHEHNDARSGVSEPQVKDPLVAAIIWTGTVSVTCRCPRGKMFFFASSYFFQIQPTPPRNPHKQQPPPIPLPKLAWSEWKRYQMFFLISLLPTSCAYLSWVLWVAFMKTIGKM